jgi:hypothetical protein
MSNEKIKLVKPSSPENQQNFSRNPKLLINSKNRTPEIKAAPPPPPPPPPAAKKGS